MSGQPELFQSVHVFGSYARGAFDPGDVDVAVDIDRDDRWRQHFISSLANGRDPYPVLRVALRGRRRGIELIDDGT
ncbi:nucleotidyltransferase domain-containing protein [Actinophytocola sp.]|uniref:nucleotidyltransferase domain-containing protein n=1 Tax=Actinophytocola sp. TaxID=1872138 RepID=UPI003D6AC1B9